MSMETTPETETKTEMTTPEIETKTEMTTPEIETTYPQIGATVWQYKLVDKAHIDDALFRKQLTDPKGWSKLGPTASQRCLHAYQNPSPYIKHFITLAPMKAYKLGLVQANEIGLCYMRLAHPDEELRLLARPLQKALFLNVILTEKEKGQVGVELVNLAGVTQLESQKMQFKKRHLFSFVRDWCLHRLGQGSLVHGSGYHAHERADDESVPWSTPGSRERVQGWQAAVYKCEEDTFEEVCLRYR